MKNVLFILIMVFCAGFARAQDRSFEQYYAHPLSFNPCMAGLVEGTFGANASHSVRRFTDNSKWNTTHLSVNYPLNFRLMQGGVGAMFVNDLGKGVNTNQFQCAFAYEVPMGQKVRYHNLRVGFQAGFIQRSLVSPDLYYEDQFDGVDFTKPTAEAYNSNTIFRPDVSMGLMWYRTQKIVGNPEFNHYLGFAVQHLTQPNIGFYNERGENLSMRWSFYGGGRMRTRTGLDFNAAVLFMMQNHSNVFTFNLNARYMFYEGGETFGYEKFGLTAGANVTVGAMVAPFLGFQWKKTYALAFSYEILTNPDRIVSNSYGGLQVTLSYTLGFLKYDKSALPFPIY